MVRNGKKKNEEKKNEVQYMNNQQATVSLEMYDLRIYFTVVKLLLNNFIKLLLNNFIK